MTPDERCDTRRRSGVRTAVEGKSGQCRTIECGEDRFHYEFHIDAETKMGEMGKCESGRDDGGDADGLHAIFDVGLDVEFTEVRAAR